jgi:NAD(P)-dependent dehydrogenase (short-subunit alcohol dehydrogenase family)
MEDRQGFTSPGQWRILITLIAGLLSQVLVADTVMITGANSGIGLELTRQYAAAGWSVIATHRRSEIPDTLAEVIARYDTVRVERMDVTRTDQIHALAEKLHGVAIDVLINNAGIYNDRRACQEEDCPGDWSNQAFGNLYYPLFDTIMAVNVRGPLMVTEAFVSHVAASGQKKIICISSTNGSLTGPFYGAGAIFYRTSKAALNRAMQLVAADLKEQGITVLLLHPGAVLTERQAYLTGYDGMIEMPFSVSNMIKTIDGIALEDSGRFIQYDGETVPW